MKLVAIYNNLDTNAENRIEAEDETFNFDESNSVAISIIQKTVDKYESLGLTIDQGGDEETYEFDLPDGCFTAEEPQFRAQAILFYDELRRNLRKAGY